MLKGTLDDFTLPDIFRLLSQSKKTGSLEVERSAGRGEVYFNEGDVYFAESSISKELLGQKLVKAGVLTSGQLMKALDEQAKSGGRLGDVLLSSGLVFEEQLEAALSAQIEDAVFDLLRWELGEFTWTASRSIEPEVSLSVSVENLVMEAARRLDELDIIKRKIPSELTVLNMASAPPEGAVEINITPDEWRVMVLVNGSRTVQEIAESVGLDVFQAMRTLYGLVSAGLIEVPEGIEPVEPAETLDVASASLDAALEDVVTADEGDAALAADEPVAIEDDAAVETDEPVAIEDDAAVETDEPVAIETDEPDAIEADEPVALDEDLSEAEPAAEVGVEEFDAPEPGDLVAEVPDRDDAPVASDAEVEVVEGDPFADEILSDTPGPARLEAVETDEPVEVSELDHSESETDIPVSADADDTSNVDKSVAVRELSNLFKQTEVDSSPTFMVPPVPDSSLPPEEKKRVEDDEEITRGLISRLIDGVKGL